MDATLGLPILVGLIAVALLFDFLNGLHDAANSIATVVSTRVLSPEIAVAFAAFFNFIAFLFFGLHVAQTIGTESTTRTFVRMDSGQQGNFSAYVSGAWHDGDKWKGEGPQRNGQFNGKAVYATDTLEITGYAATSRRRETDYADLSLESARRLGYDWDNYAGDWQRAIDAANGCAGPERDLEGRARVDVTSVTNTGVSPFSDLGAYEAQLPGTSYGAFTTICP